MNRTPGEFFDAIPPTPSNDDVGTPFLDLIRNVRKADRFVGRQIGRIDGKGWDALKSSGRFLINHHKASTEVHRTMLAERAAQAALEANQEEESLPKRGRWITREDRMSDRSRKTEEVRIATLLEKGRQFVIIGSLIFGAMSIGIG